MGSVETLIVWENLDCNRIVLKNHSTGGMLPFYCLWLQMPSVSMRFVLIVSQAQRLSLMDWLHRNKKKMKIDKHFLVFYRV